MSEEVSKTESGLSEKDQKILSMLTPGERIILERLLELFLSGNTKSARKHKKLRKLSRSFMILIRLGSLD